MGVVEGARSFATSGESYDAFMGRYSQALAPVFADQADVTAGHRALDVGCGPGALTAVLVDRLGTGSVSAVDPSPPFAQACRARFPSVDVREGRAEALPFEDAVFDIALAQLVLHFTSDAAAAAAEMARVVRPGGLVGACVWDFADEMQMLRLYWDSALALDPGAPDEARTLRFGREGEVAELFGAAGLHDVREDLIVVESTYRDVDELWAGFLAGVGPAGTHCLSLAEDQRAAVRQGIEERLGHPTGSFTLSAGARSTTARTPS